GNGTAAIFAEEPHVFTFSMHQQANYPALKPPSNLDVGLRDGIDDDDYLALLEDALERVWESAPGLVIYLAGADPYRQDQLGGLNLTQGGLRRRDRAVLEWARGHGVPVAVTLAGGYAIDPRDTVRIRAATVEEAISARGG
ncbi:MAG: arginase family protein, partial [Planctomycetota bacterium]